jgi:hypothetical protein
MKKLTKGGGGDSNRPRQAPFRQAEAEGDAQASEPIDEAAAESDRRGLLEIFRRACDLGNGVPQPANLGKELVVENKVVGIPLEGNCFH